MMNGVSICTSAFASSGPASLSMPAMMRAAAEAGYSQVEISRDHCLSENDLALMPSIGVRVWAVHGTLGGAHVFDDEARRRASVANELERMRWAAACAPCPYVVHYTSRFHDPRTTVAFRRSIEELLPVAEQMKLTLAIETVPNKPQNERYPDSREVADFARSFENPTVRVCLDVNHSNLVENLGDVAANCRGLIADIHVSDNHGKLEEHLPPGEGIIDLPAAMQSISDAGYAGPLNLELRMPDFPTVSELIRLRKWAEEVIAGLRAGSIGT